MKKASNAKGQTVESIVVNGADPRQSAWWDGLAERTALELSAAGAPLSIRYGITGSPVRTWYGDSVKIGSMQVILPAPSYGAINAFPALNADQALPATGSPSVTSQTLKGLLGELDNANAW